MRRFRCQRHVESLRFFLLLLPALPLSLFDNDCIEQINNQLNDNNIVLYNRGTETTNEANSNVATSEMPVNVVTAFLCARTSFDFMPH